MKIKDLVNRVNYLNKITQNRVDKSLPYKINNKLVSNKGHYYISQYNGNFGIEQIVNTSGGCTDIGYRGTKQEIYNYLNAFINGYETAYNLYITK